MASVLIVFVESEQLAGVRCLLFKAAKMRSVVKMTRKAKCAAGVLVREVKNTEG